MNDDDLKMVLLYRDRTWSEVETPLRIPDNFSNWSEVLHQNGWVLSTHLGDTEGLSSDEEGISIDLYYRRHDAESCQYRWLAEYNTSGPCQTIVMERNQDMIDFLAHVSSTMLVAVLPPDINMILHELFERTPHRIEERERMREDRLHVQREAKP